MTENERETHAQDPAEGPDDEERQNEERKLDEGDEVTAPGGDEPPD